MIFKAFGIKFEFSYIFLSALTVFIAVDRTKIFIPLVISVFLHELSHIFFLKIYRCKIYSIKLKIGTLGIEYDDCMNKKQKIITLLSGPLANLLIAMMLNLLSLQMISAINFLLFLYNLIPIKGLDGGEILEIVLSSFFSYNVIVIVQKIISIFIILLITLCFFVLLKYRIVNYSILLFALYLSFTLM